VEYEPDGTSTTYFGGRSKDLNTMFTHINEDTGTTLRFYAQKISGKGACVSDILMLTAVNRVIFNDYTRGQKKRYVAEHEQTSGADDGEVRSPCFCDPSTSFRLTSRSVQVTIVLVQVTGRAPGALRIERMGGEDPRGADDLPGATKPQHAAGPHSTRYFSSLTILSVDCS
jgi:hypothetical protein